MNVKYYLDTNEVQSLGLKLESISSEWIFTSIWAQIELVSAIKDDDSFRRKKAALKHLSDSRIYVDQAIPSIKRLQAFGMVEPEPYDFSVFRERIIPIVINSIDYDEYLKRIHDSGLEKSLKSIRDVDNLSSISGKYIANNTYEIIDFENKWKGNKSGLIQDAVDYHAGKLEERYGLPKWYLIEDYDHSIDYFMLIHYYYVEQKKHAHEKPARNDFNDICHLLYLKDGCKLVTDDGKFQEYVNKMADGLSIGTEQFLNEINYK